jgi:hypothetical protein
MRFWKGALATLIAVAVATVTAFAAATYPSSIRAFPLRSTGDVIQAAFFNDPYDEITAIETDLINGMRLTVKPLTTNLYDLGTVSLLWRSEYLAQTLNGTQGTITASTPFLNLTSTWNAGAVTFQGILLNVTDTASAAASTFLDLQKAGVSQFKVDKAGSLTILNDITTGRLGVGVVAGGGSGQITATAGITFAGPLLFSTDNAADIGASGANRPRDLFLARVLNINTPNLGAMIQTIPNGVAVPALILRGVASQTGDLLDLQNSAANNIFQFTSTASMVNGIQFNPANAGSVPSIAAIGTDANINFRFIAKGSGNIDVGVAGSLFTFISGAVPNPVDFITLTPAATANPATVSWAATGSDANINLSLVSKGTGGVLVGGYSATMIANSLGVFGGIAIGNVGMQGPTSINGPQGWGLAVVNTAQPVVTLSAGATVIPVSITDTNAKTSAVQLTTITGTWNAAVVFPGALFVNITDTLSSAGSLLADFQKGGISQFKVDKLGNTVLLGTLTTASGTVITGPGTAASIALAVQGTASQAGDLLRLSNSGSSPIFQFTSLASMVDGIAFDPSTAANPGIVGIRAIGTDANVVVAIKSLGTGAINFYGGGGGYILGSFGNVVSAVDYVLFTPAATANPATVSVQCVGTDANCNLNLISKGTGTVQINGVAPAAAPTITIKKGTGLGNYSLTTTVADIDATNLALTVTVPVGQKIMIWANATCGTGSSVQPHLVIADGTTALADQQADTAGGSSMIGVIYVFVGDGASHTFKLRGYTASGSSAVINTSAILTPMMTFWMGVAN